MIFGRRQSVAGAAQVAAGGGGPGPGTVIAGDAIGIKRTVTVGIGAGGTLPVPDRCKRAIVGGQGVEDPFGVRCLIDMPRRPDGIGYHMTGSTAHIHG